MFRDRRRRIVVGLKHHGIYQIPQPVLLPLPQIAFDFRHRCRARGNRDQIVRISVFQCKNTGHDLCRARHRHDLCSVFLIQHPVIISIKQQGCTRIKRKLLLPVRSFMQNFPVLILFLRGRLRKQAVCLRRAAMRALHTQKEHKQPRGQYHCCRAPSDPFFFDPDVTFLKHTHPSAVPKTSEQYMRMIPCVFRLWDAPKLCGSHIV